MQSSPATGLLFCPPPVNNQSNQKENHETQRPQCSQRQNKKPQTRPISSLVVLEIAPKVQIVSTITAESAAALKLKKGQTAYAVIKASSVMVGVDE